MFWSHSLCVQVRILLPVHIFFGGFKRPRVSVFVLKMIVHQRHKQHGGAAFFVFFFWSPQQRSGAINAPWNAFASRSFAEYMYMLLWSAAREPNHKSCSGEEGSKRHRRGNMQQQYTTDPKTAPENFSNSHPHLRARLCALSVLNKSARVHVDDVYYIYAFCCVSDVCE